MDQNNVSDWLLGKDELHLYDRIIEVDMPMRTGPLQLEHITDFDDEIEPDFGEPLIIRKEDRAWVLKNQKPF